MDNSENGIENWYENQLKPDAEALLLDRLNFSSISASITQRRALTALRMQGRAIERE